MLRREGDIEGDRDEKKDGGRGFSAVRVQTLLERNADAVYGAAAFFVTLAFLILVLTPTSVEVMLWYLA